MACPLCGEVCRCTLDSREPPRKRMRGPRFEPDVNTPIGEGAILIDPEAPGHCDEQFAASLLKPRPGSRSRFVADEAEIDALDAEDGATSDQTMGGAVTCADAPASLPAELQEGTGHASSPGDRCAPCPDEARFTAESDSNSLEVPAQESSSSAAASADRTFWKDEVAARLNYYRSRRKPRPPKYPSLRLKFDMLPRTSASELVADDRVYAASRESLALETAGERSSLQQPELPASRSETLNPNLLPGPETARIIAFPRSHYDIVYTVPVTGNELADPVFETPRIVEVPEVETPAPALGGIILEPEEREPERRPGFEIPLQSAPMGRRLVAALSDGCLVVSAYVLFGYIVFKITGALPLAKNSLSLGAGLLGVFWTTYQYLLLTYANLTPGLRLARLRLRQFDGAPVGRSTRRWRVFASILSGLSLGLGYAWCFLDEDALCWHDRITGTYLEISE